MEGEKTFVVGDIHGCLDMFKRLMDLIKWQPNRDRIIFVGDYIDRGKNPKGVVDYILALKRCSHKIECLIGNHEVLLLNFLDGKNQELYYRNGGWSTLESYRADRAAGEGSLIPPDHLDYFRSLKPYIETDDYYVVHAGFRPGLDVSQQLLDDMVWIREPFIYSAYDFGKRVIFGHTPFYEPFVRKNKIGIDTGAVFGNRLTCLELSEFRFYSVEAKENHHIGIFRDY